MGSKGLRPDDVPLSTSKLQQEEKIFYVIDLRILKFNKHPSDRLSQLIAS